MTVLSYLSKADYVTHDMKNLTHQHNNWPIYLIVAAFSFVGCLYSPYPSNASNLDIHAALTTKLQQLNRSSLRDHHPLPLMFETTYVDGYGSTHLYLLSDISYASFTHFFEKNTWCEALILQIHIKACVQHNNDLLDIYLGTDDYAEPDDVFKFEYLVNKRELSRNQLQLSMTALDGPLDSKNYRINLEIIPIADGKSFLHFHFQAFYGFFIRTTISTYLLTAGRNKVGLSILNPTSVGELKYQTGMEGILERNAIRYVLAFIAYLEVNPKGDNKNWLVDGLQRWHRYTEKFYLQLYDMSLEDYMLLKMAEYKNQLVLENPELLVEPNEEWPGD